MRWAVVLGLACGCNQLFGIQQTDLVDAPPTIPPIDAPPPPACPAMGTAPVFGPDLVQVPARNCSSYVVDTAGGVAAAICTDSTSGAPVLATGPAGEVLVAQLPQPMPDYIYFMRLAPEGDSLFITTYNATTFNYDTTEYRNLSGAWTLAGNAFRPNVKTYELYTLSTPSRGPLRRFVTSLYDSTAGSWQIVELEYNGSALTELWRTELAETTADSFDTPSLSADGLRLVFTSYSNELIGGTWDPVSPAPPEMLPPEKWGQLDQTVYYMDRASVADRFQGEAKPLDTVPSAVTWPHLSEDCGRIYFSALNTVWYLKQLQ